ncbi:MAG TPA: hypothetical protein VH597_08175 [Verrucomicrobiae bacterium]|nr:hypothetical protein [Verrucomicrobiae bacterium]
MPTKTTFAKGICRALIGLFFAVCFSSLAITPAVIITNLPAYGATDTLKGYVIGANPATQALAVFIYVPNFGWVNKPFCTPLLVPILPDGSWSANITTGGTNDTTATRIAALLVSTNYNQGCVAGSNTLPTSVYAQAVAKAIVTRPSPGVRFFSFAGYDWWVKSPAGLAGPGPNYFSDSTNNIFTDTNGWLHLRITHRTNAWQCAEVVSARTFGPGNYRFEVNTPVDNLNQNITLGLFTWSDDPTFTDREIDVEGGRWGNPADVNNAQFVVQPFDGVNHLVRYPVPAGLADTTHFFIWETNRIRWQAQTNSFSADATNVFASYTFNNAADIPASGDENVRLNLWLVNGTPPSDNNEQEVVIKNFNFVPLGAPPSAVLSNPKNTSGAVFQTDLRVQPDFHYDIQVSSNLFVWNDLMTVLATSDKFTLLETNSPTGSKGFFRAVTLP